MISSLRMQVEFVINASYSVHACSRVRQNFRSPVGHHNCLLFTQHPMLQDTLHAPLLASLLLTENYVQCSVTDCVGGLLLSSFAETTEWQQLTCILSVVCIPLLCRSPQDSCLSPGFRRQIDFAYVMSFHGCVHAR